jgi:hypothetical protein
MCEGVDWFIWLRIGTSVGIIKYGNEPSDSVKGEELSTSWATIRL